MNRSVSILRVGIWMAALAALAAGGCPQDLAGLTPNSDPDSQRQVVGEAFEGSFVGQVKGSLALIGVVAGDERVIAYVCDGDDGPKSISQWYQGRLAKDGTFRIEGDDLSTYYRSSGSWTLTGKLGDELASGELMQAGGKSLPWDARVVPPDSPAGLYVGGDDEIVTSIVVANERWAQGLTRSRGGSRVGRVTTPTRLDKGGSFQVETGRRSVTVEVVHTPIDLVGAGILDRLQDRVKPEEPERPDREGDLGPPLRIPAPSNTIQVKFRDGLLIRLDREGRLIDRRGVALTSKAAQQLLDLVSKGRWNRSHLVSERQIDDWRQNGEKLTGEKLPDLNLYFNLQLPPDLDAKEIAARFKELKEVEGAWVMPDYYLAEAPDFSDYRGVDPGGELPYQKYLDPAPVGVDARYAWGFPGGDGAGVTLVDIEYAFNSNHVELSDVALGTVLLPENPDPDYVNHGTATLGVIAGSDDESGVTGIAHGASTYFGTFSLSADYAIDLAIGLDGALTYSIIAQELERGDVIVLELQIPGPFFTGTGQYGLVAVEWYKPTFDAIRIAAANGFVVVEAAGNGSQNLNSPAYLNDPDAPHQPFRVDSGERVNDSGGIIVGAGFSDADWTYYTSFAGPARSRHGYSNYGDRVDLQAWGDAVVTAGPGKFTPSIHDVDGTNATYRDDYAGTSSATALMGGIVSAYQGFYKEYFQGATLPSRSLRDILRATGTPQGGDTTQNIGPLPDLRAAIEAITFSSEPPPPPLEDEFPDLCGELPYVIEPGPYCGTDLPFPAPTFTIPTGVLNIDEPVNLFMLWGDGYVASGTIYYTVDGSTPINCLAQSGSSCGVGSGVYAWHRTNIEHCIPIEISPDDLPLTIRALSTTALCLPRPSSAISTAIYVPPGYINTPEFDRPSQYGADLCITMRTTYPDDYPDGFAFVAYTLDGSDPVYGDDAPDGISSPTWTDWYDDFGYCIPIFTDGQTEVTLKARNYLYMGHGVYVGGEIVEWTYPLLQP